jgi:hypothetical protein
MSYYLYLVETKKEYTIHLVNALAPLMYEGVSSIYEDAKNNASEGEELRLFQNLLRKIPSWNEHLIEQETNRIVKISNKGEIIEDLIKAVIKSNIMILTNTPPEKKDNLRIKHDISTQKFIHNSYMEVARNIFQNPYLYYHKYNSYELKKNQREATDLIKKSIEQSIRKLLPMNLVLQNYLGSTFEAQTDDFENSIPDSDYNNLRNMLNKDPINNDETYQLVKKNDSATKSVSNVNQPSLIKSVDPNNERVNVKLDIPKSKYETNSSDNFKTLKELNKQNNSPIENKTNQILLTKTEQAIKEYEKRNSNISESVKDTTKNKNDIDTHKQSESIAKQTDKHTDKQTESIAKHTDKQTESIAKYTDKQTDNHSDKQSESINKSPDKPAETLAKQTEQTTKLNDLSEHKYVSIRSSRSIKSSKANSVENQTEDEDASVSYFRQYSNKDDIAEVYDNERHKNNALNDKVITQNGGYQNNTSNEKKSNTKQFIKYNDFLNADNSSDHLNSILKDVSSIDAKANAKTKKKYFNANANL